ncbi:MAG: hypothetical protein ACI3VN_04680 [Candidatus Onthomonas sp.]
MMRRFCSIFLALLLCVGSCFTTADGAETGNRSRQGWLGDTIVENGDTTRTIHGRVRGVYTDGEGNTVWYTVQASVVASAYGRTWTDCSAEGSFFVEGNADTIFIGDCGAQIISGTRLRMTLDGYLQVTQYDETGTEVTGYVRYPVEETHVETLSQSGGTWICGQ